MTDDRMHPGHSGWGYAPPPRRERDRGRGPGKRDRPQGPPESLPSSSKRGRFPGAHPPLATFDADYSRGRQSYDEPPQDRFAPAWPRESTRPPTWDAPPLGSSRFPGPPRQQHPGPPPSRDRHDIRDRPRERSLGPEPRPINVRSRSPPPARRPWPPQQPGRPSPKPGSWRDSYHERDRNRDRAYDTDRPSAPVSTHVTLGSQLSSQHDQDHAGLTRSRHQHHQRSERRPGSRQFDRHQESDVAGTLGERLDSFRGGRKVRSPNGRGTPAPRANGTHRSYDKSPVEHGMPLPASPMSSGAVGADERGSSPEPGEVISHEDRLAKHRTPRLQESKVDKWRISARRDEGREKLAKSQKSEEHVAAPLLPAPLPPPASPPPPPVDASLDGPGSATATTPVAVHLPPPAPVSAPAAETIAAPKTSLELLAAIEEVEGEAERLQEEVQDVTLELSRLEMAEPRLRKALDKVQAASPASPEPPGGSDDEELAELSSDEDDAVEKRHAAGGRTAKGRHSGGNRRRGRGRGKNGGARSHGRGNAADVENGDEEKEVPPPRALPPALRCLTRRLGALLREQEGDETVTRVLAQSRDLAVASSSRFAHLVPPQSKASDSKPSAIKDGDGDEAQHAMECECGMQNAVAAPRSATMVPPSPPPHGVATVLRREFRAMLCAQTLAAIEYRTRQDKWIKKQQQQAMHRVASGTLSNRSGGGGAGMGGDGQPLSPSLGRSSSRRNAGFVRSDLEERQAIATLQVMEQIKRMVQLPTMSLVSPRAARWEIRYQDRNRLVVDPEADIFNFTVTRPWSEAELEMFAEKFLAHHKDFARIAAYFPGRTVPEIVRLYYAVQKDESFDNTRRKWQLRKRRERAEEHATYQRLSISAMVAPPTLPAASSEEEPSLVEEVMQVEEQVEVWKKERRQEAVSDQEMEVATAEEQSNEGPEAPVQASEPPLIAEDAKERGTRAGAKQGTGRARGRGGRRGAAERGVVNLTASVGMTTAFLAEPPYPEPPVPAGRGPRAARGRATLVELPLCAADWAETEDREQPADAQVAMAYGMHYAAAAMHDEEFGDAGDALDSDDDDVAPEMEAKLRAAASRAKNSLSSASSFGQGRGRLPKAATDIKFQEAARRFGQDFVSIAAFVGGGRNAAKAAEFWERHNERLGLDALAEEYNRSGPLSLNSGSELSWMPDMAVWQPVIAAVRASESNSLAPNGGSLRSVHPSAMLESETASLDPARLATAEAAGGGNVGVVGASAVAGAQDQSQHARLLSLLAAIPEEETRRVVSLLQPGAPLAACMQDESVAAALAATLSKLNSVPVLAFQPGLISRLVDVLEEVTAMARAGFSVPGVGPLGDPSIAACGNAARKGRRGRTSPWSADEKDALLAAYSEHGLNYDRLHEAVPLKTLDQIRNFYNNNRATLFDSIELPPTAVHPLSRKRKGRPPAKALSNKEAGAAILNVKVSEEQRYVTLMDQGSVAMAKDNGNEGQLYGAVKVLRPPVTVFIEQTKTRVEANLAVFGGPEGPKYEHETSIEDEPVDIVGKCPPAPMQAPYQTLDLVHEQQPAADATHPTQPMRNDSRKDVVQGESSHEAEVVAQVGVPATMPHGSMCPVMDKSGDGVQAMELENDATYEQAVGVKDEQEMDAMGIEPGAQGEV